MHPTLFDCQILSRRTFIKLGGAASLALLMPACSGSTLPPAVTDKNQVLTRTTVPDPARIGFTVQLPGKDPLRLRGHFWYDAAQIAQGRRLPAIVELNPYRCRDGTMHGDSAW